MEDRIEIRLSGSGGQGLNLAGLILAEAAGIYDRMEVSQTQSYGSQVRGGISESEVVISKDKIDYPRVLKADLLLALTQEAYDKYIGDLKEKGILIVDSSAVTKIPPISVKIYKLPIVETAQKEIGNIMVTNILSLGIITGISNVVSEEAIKKAVLARIPAKVKKVNERALLLGFNMAKNLILEKN